MKFSLLALLLLTQIAVAQDSELEGYNPVNALIKKNKVRYSTCLNQDFPQLTQKIEYDTLGREISSQYQTSNSYTKSVYTQSNDTLIVSTFRIDSNRKLLLAIEKYAYSKNNDIVFYSRCRRCPEACGVESSYTTFIYDSARRMKFANYYYARNYPASVNTNYPLIDSFYKFRYTEHYIYNNLSQLIVQKKIDPNGNLTLLDSFFYTSHGKLSKSISHTLTDIFYDVDNKANNYKDIMEYQYTDTSIITISTSEYNDVAMKSIKNINRMDETVLNSKGLMTGLYSTYGKTRKLREVYTYEFY